MGSDLAECTERTHSIEDDQFAESLDEATLVGLGNQAVVVHPSLLPHACYVSTQQRLSLATSIDAQIARLSITCERAYQGA